VRFCDGTLSQAWSEVIMATFHFVMAYVDKSILINWLEAGSYVFFLVVFNKMAG
jgi:hypothetical protein